MSRLRPRWRLNRLMILTAVLALTLAWAMRPYPVVVLIDGSVAFLRWSDGSATGGQTSKMVVPIGYDEYRLARRVRWSDGSVSYHVHRSVAYR